MVIEMQKVIQKKVEKEMQECYYSKLGLNEAEKYIKGLMSRAHYTGCSSLSVEKDGVRMNYGIFCESM